MVSLIHLAYTSLRESLMWIQPWGVPWFLMPRFSGASGWGRCSEEASRGAARKDEGIDSEPPPQLGRLQVVGRSAAVFSVAKQGR